MERLCPIDNAPSSHPPPFLRGALADGGLIERGLTRHDRGSSPPSHPACPPISRGARRMRPKGQRNGSRRITSCRIVALAMLAAAPAAQGGDEPVRADHARAMARGLELFKGGVRDTIVQSCLECHGGKATKGDFDLSTRET